VRIEEAKRFSIPYAHNVAAGTSYASLGSNRVFGCFDHHCGLVPATFANIESLSYIVERHEAADTDKDGYCNAECTVDVPMVKQCLGSSMAFVNGLFSIVLSHNPLAVTRPE
jgi:hypothetical protein